MTGVSFAVVDSGPLVAALDADDEDHERSLTVLRRPDLRFVIPSMVVAEVCYMAGTYLGSAAQAAFLRGLARYDVQVPFAEDWPRIAALVEQYAGFPLGGTDASVVVLAERLDTDLVVTLDERHFRAVRPRHVEAFRLLPADA